MIASMNKSLTVMSVALCLLTLSVAAQDGTVSMSIGNAIPSPSGEFLLETGSTVSLHIQTAAGGDVVHVGVRETGAKEWQLLGKISTDADGQFSQRVLIPKQLAGMSFELIAAVGSGKELSLSDILSVAIEAPDVSKPADNRKAYQGKLPADGDVDDATKASDERKAYAPKPQPVPADLLPETN